VSYIHELITIIMAKREPNGVDKEVEETSSFLQQCFSPTCRKDQRSGARFLDRPSVSFMAVEESPSISPA
jgi:hypothetical protein